MLTCIFNPGSCIPEWIKLVVTYWDSLLAVFLVGMVVGGLVGWKGIVGAALGLLALVMLRFGKGGDDKFTGQVDGDDAKSSDDFVFGRKPKGRVRRTAKRSANPPAKLPPESLTR